VQKNGIRTGYSAPLTSRELAIDVQRVFGDLALCVYVKGCAAIAATT
jgi:hypothetical protein